MALTTASAISSPTAHRQAGRALRLPQLVPVSPPLQKSFGVPA